MDKILNNKYISLICTIINSVFALHSFINGSWLFGWLCVVFAVICGRNYLMADNSTE